MMGKVDCERLCLNYRGGGYCGLQSERLDTTWRECSFYRPAPTADLRRTNPLTAKQSRVLDLIKQRVAEQGYPPTLREIADGLGLHSPSTVSIHLANLEQNGYIKRDPTKPRAITVLG